MKHFLTLLAILILHSVHAQVIIIPTGALAAATMPEHGFLPGKKFKFYPTNDKYDFKGLKLRVELTDNREVVKLNKILCSDLPFTNTSEFSDPACIHKVQQYIDTLFKQSNIVSDPQAIDILKVSLEGIDARIIGAGYVRAHGLCQMKINYHDIEKTYCVDITDADKHSPVGPNAFVTRLTATRIMASAAIREVIEQFMADLSHLN